MQHAHQTGEHLCKQGQSVARQKCNIYCIFAAVLFSAGQAQATFGIGHVTNHQILNPVRQERPANLAGLVNADRTV